MSYKTSFIFLYLFIYMFLAVSKTFIPLYMDSLGFSRSLIGVLLAVGPFIAIIAQPLWGIVGDRSKTKNSILKIMILGSAIAFMMFPVSDSFYYLIFIMAVFTFFQISIIPINDAIALEYITSNNLKYGPIRLAGTLGFAIMSLISGVMAKEKLTIVFPLYLFIALLAYLVTFEMPVVKGHQSKNKKVSYWELLKNTELVVLLVFSLIIQSTLGIYYSFFPVYYRHLGANNALVGAVMFIASLSEVPFLIFADSIIKKLGMNFTLLCSAFVMGLRWLFMYFATKIFVFLFINAMHGFSIVVFCYCLAVYINDKVPKELRASGQTMFGMIGTGIAGIIGSILGGIFSDMVGTRTVFLYSSIVNFVTTMVIACIFWSRKHFHAEHN